jgi:hypothetical protein
MRANFCGMARYAAMERAVLAVGRIVVWVEADAEVRIEAESNNNPTFPRKLSPNRAGPIAAKTSLELSGFPSPIPLVPTPANAIAETVTTA